MHRRSTPLSSLFLASFILLAVLVGMTFAVFAARKAPFELVILLIVPIFYAAFYYPRWIHRVMLIVTVAVWVWVVYYNADHVQASLTTTCILAFTVLVSAESIQRAVVKSHQREEAFRESEERYRDLIEHSNDVIWRVDTQGLITFVSPASKRVLGYDPGELTGVPFDKFLTEESARRARQTLERRARGELGNEGITVELTYRRKDGTELVAETWSTPILSPSGKVIEIQGVSHDVTERKQSERRERAVTAGLRAVLGAADELMACADVDSLFRRAVELARERLGLDRCAIFVEDDGYMRGTYGTNRHGQTTAEHASRFSIAQDWWENLRARLAVVRPQDPRWVITEGPHTEWDGEKSVQIGEGWVAATLIQSSRGRIGVLFNDAAITGAAVHEVQQEIVAVYCTLLGRIIERRQAEEALRESQERLKAVFDGAIDSIFVKDIQGRYVSVNKACEESYGLPEKEIIGKTDCDFFPPANAQHIQETDERVVGGQVVKEEHTTPFRGEIHTFDVTKVPLYDEQGEVFGICGIARDITKRKQTEETLRASEAKYRLLTENLRQSVFLKDVESRFVSVNSSFCSLLGLRPEDIVGKADQDFFPKDLAEKYRADDRRVIETGETLELTEENVVGGTRRWVQVVKTPVKDAEGKITGILGIFWDVTEQKQAEEERWESEKRYRLLAENVTDIIWTMDMNLRYTYVSPSVERLVGFSVEEHMSKTPEETLTPASYELAMRVFQEELAIEKSEEKDLYRSRTLELEQLRKDGSTVWTEVRMTFLRDEHHRPVGILGVTRDITERKRAQEECQRLEAQIQHAQKLESLGILAGGIAHDFNNLLMGILGNASLALMELPPESPARESLQQIEKTSQRAAELSRQMLAYSGRGRFVVRALNLSELVKEMGHLLEVSISKNAALQYNLHPALPAIKGDATQIHQVIINLITNASEAIGDKSGVISVTTGVMECSSSYLARTYMNDSLPGGTYVYIEVADTGCGMDAKTQAKIFDPFFTTKFTGRGLGLAVVLGVVRGHRGAVKVDSEPGQGTTCRIFFPCSPGPVGVPAQAPSDIREWRGTGAVLVVDDEESVRLVVRRMLERFGFTVLTAADGYEGLQVLRQHVEKIVAVLLDLTMPGMDGEETFRQMRHLRADVPVILSSGYDEQDVASRFAGKGLAGFIQKPYQPTELIAKLRSVLEHPA